jgi:hypothetical protein
VTRAPLSSISTQTFPAFSPPNSTCTAAFGQRSAMTFRKVSAVFAPLVAGGLLFKSLVIGKYYMHGISHQDRFSAKNSIFDDKWQRITQTGQRWRWRCAATQGDSGPPLLAQWKDDSPRSGASRHGERGFMSRGFWQGHRAAGSQPRFHLLQEVDCRF